MREKAAVFCRQQLTADGKAFPHPPRIRSAPSPKGRLIQPRQQLSPLPGRPAVDRCAGELVGNAALSVPLDFERVLAAERRGRRSLRIDRTFPVKRQGSHSCEQLRLPLGEAVSRKAD